MSSGQEFLCARAVSREFSKRLQAGNAADASLVRLRNGVEGQSRMTNKKIDLIQRYFLARNARADWPDEVARRAEGMTAKITSDFFFHMNPLFEPNMAMRYVVGRYEAAYDALAQLRPKSVLEIGCAQGLSTWLMTSYAGEVVGLDIREERTAVGRHVFPEVEMVTGDWLHYLEQSGRKFDVIVCSHGPFHWHEALPRFCDRYIHIGYRTASWAEALRGAHKIEGRQLSFSTTMWGGGDAGLGSAYGRYYMRRNWLKEARHALVSGNALPL